MFVYPKNKTTFDFYKCKFMDNFVNEFANSYAMYEWIIPSKI